MVKAGNAAADRVLELLDQESSLKDKSDAFAKASFNDNIKFNNITFAYEELPVLKGFTLKVNKGQKVALVGQSGSGKSTIASLLNRFYDVGEGSIEIDGYDIRNLTKESLRDLIGFVSQDSILFNETIKNNVTLGKEDVTDEEVIEALKIANAWEFVKDFPNGIHTNVGDSGGKLSGGQKQRVSIARAVLKNPPIMLLDEATSALDTESERLVQDALEKMMRNRTSIVIAHRLSTIQNSDHIVVLERGQIVEQGNHKSLMQQQTTYYSLVNMQSLV
jgi:subfamily B ATP-binding cassette protein MsbA